MNPFNPNELSANPFARKIQNEYTFNNNHDMSSFVHKLSRNSGVTKIDLKSKDTLQVTYRNQETMNSVDATYNESFDVEDRKKNLSKAVSATVEVEEPEKKQNQSFTTNPLPNMTDALNEVGRLANQPLVKTGQGSYEKKIRPSDILKRKKKKKK